MLPLSFDFSFPSIVGDGKCSITIGTAPQSKIEGYVIICSQKRHYSGISVTNALEMIAAELFRKIVVGELNPYGAVGDEDILKNLRGSWIKNLKSKSSRSLGDIYKEGLATWVEHYPAGTGLMPDERFTQVWFDADGNPTWLPGKNAIRAAEEFGTEVVNAAIDFSRKA